MNRMIVEVPRTDNPFPRTGISRDENGIPCFDDLPPTLLDVLRSHVEIRPDSEAVVEVGGDRLSYRQLWDAAARVAGGLRAAGLRRAPCLDRAAALRPVRHARKSASVVGWSLRPAARLPSTSVQPRQPGRTQDGRPRRAFAPGPRRRAEQLRLPGRPLPPGRSYGTDRAAIGLRRASGYPRPRVPVAGRTTATDWVGGPLVRVVPSSCRSGSATPAALARARARGQSRHSRSSHRPDRRTTPARSAPFAVSVHLRQQSAQEPS